MKKQYIFVLLIIIMLYSIFLIGNYKYKEYAINSHIEAMIDIIADIRYDIKMLSEKIFNVQIAPINALPLPIPFGGTAVNVPGTIETENQDEGGQGVAYNDTEEENLAETAGSATYRDDDGVDVQVSTNGLLTSVGYTAADE